MNTLSKTASTSPVIEIRRRVDAWRKTRQRRGTPMPSHLWKEAADLARVHGINPIARALGLEYYALKGHVDGVDRSRARALSRRGFVEVAVCPPPPTPASDSLVEVERSDGAKVRVRLSNQEDLLAVLASFWGCRP